MVALLQYLHLPRGPTVFDDLLIYELDGLCSSSRLARCLVDLAEAAFAQLALQFVIFVLVHVVPAKMLRNQGMRPNADDIAWDPYTDRNGSQ